jgi:hypothetical protein
MLRKIKHPLALLALSAALFTCGMLGLYSTACAQQQRGTQLPFSNSVEQRGEMVRELKEIKGLLREQNALLRTLVNHASNSTATSDAPPATNR